MNLRSLFAGLAVLAALPFAAQAAPAPDFTVTDAAGKPVRLADYRGRHVVLEWTNPECPFVRKHYTSRNMQTLQKEYGGKGVVWLAVNSTRASHEEFKTGPQMAAWMTAQGAAPAATLIDGTSATGRAYGARATPQMFVIDPAGAIVYSGAIDDHRSANPDDVRTAKNWVRTALDESLAGKPVSTPNTQPYGCSVKY
jgi:peroxiredoxin